MTVGPPVPRDTSAPNRAQVEVLGVVLLIGMVSIAALGLMLVASGAVADNEAQAEKERVEQSFVQLSHTMATATANGEMPESIDFDAGDSGAITKTDAGTFTIRGGDVNETITVGAIEYEHEDGSIVAYQAGGVWAEQGNQTRMLSAPPIRYDPTDETLVMPVTDMAEGEDLSSGRVQIGREKSDPVRAADLVENDTVTVTIESEYYRGWEQFFTSRTGDGVVQDIDHENRSVTVEFGLREADGDFSDGAYAGGGGIYATSNSKHDVIQGSVTATGEISGKIDGDENADDDNPPTPIDTVIDSHLEDTEDADPIGNLTSDEYVGGKTYYADNGWTTNEDTTLDLNGENTTILVDGDVSIENTITLNNEADNALRIYASGDLTVTGAEVNDGNGASHFQVYGTSSMLVGISDAHFEGVVYAPRVNAALSNGASNTAYEESSNGNGQSSNGKGHSCELPDTETDADVCIGGGNPKVVGSIVAGPLVTGHAGSQGNNLVVEHDPSVTNVEPELYLDDQLIPPNLTYLNVAIHEMDVSN